MTRRTFFRLLALLPLGLLGRPRHVEPFSDVEGVWGQAIEVLHERGLTAGVGAGLFDPHRALTRAEAAVFMSRLQYGASYFPPTLFADEEWGFKWVRQAVNDGLMKADALRLRNEPATRSDIAVLLYLALGV